MERRSYDLRKREEQLLGRRHNLLATKKLLGVTAQHYWSKKKQDGREHKEGRKRDTKGKKLEVQRRKRRVESQMQIKERHGKGERNMGGRTQHACCPGAKRASKMRRMEVSRQ